MTVHSIATGRPLDSANSKDLLNLLLEMAGEGVIAAIAISVVHVDGSSENMLGIDSPFNPDALVGSLERMKLTIIDSTTDDAEEVIG